MQGGEAYMNNKTNKTSSSNNNSNSRYKLCRTNFRQDYRSKTGICKMNVRGVMWEVGFVGAY